MMMGMKRSPPQWPKCIRTYVRMYTVSSLLWMSVNVLFGVWRKEVEH